MTGVLQPSSFSSKLRCIESIFLTGETLKFKKNNSYSRKNYLRNCIRFNLQNLFRFENISINCTKQKFRVLQILRDEVKIQRSHRSKKSLKAIWNLHIKSFQNCPIFKLISIKIENEQGCFNKEALYAKHIDLAE